MLVIVGCSNAVNLTDGLDGLAIGPVMTVAFCYWIFTYVAGNHEVRQLPRGAARRRAGELAIFCAALIAASMGFLWYNAYPASMMMGDVGALSLGGALGTVAVLSKQELVLLIAGGVFVIEAGLGHHPALLLQDDAPADFPDGAAASSLRTWRMAGDGGRALLDNFDRLRAGRAQHA